MNSHLCLHPFQSMMSFNSGEVKMCCDSSPMGDLRHADARSIWNSEKWQKVRREFLAGRKPGECAVCWRSEARSGVSGRMPGQPGNPLVAKCESSGVMKELPRRLSIRLGNECNLKCIMCSPMNSSKWAEDEDLAIEFGIGQKLEESFAATPILEDHWLDEALNEADWIQFIGGEPLIIKKHLTILEALIQRGRAAEVTLVYSTNLSFLPEWCLRYWPKFKKVSINASIDGTGETYEFIRYPQKWPKVEQNLIRVKELAEQNCQLSLLPVYMSVNAMNIPELFHWRNRQSWSSPPEIRITFLTDPHFLSARHLSEEDKLRARFGLEGLLASECQNEEEKELIRDALIQMAAPAESAQRQRLNDYLNAIARRRAR